MSSTNPNSVKCGTCQHYSEGPAHPRYPDLCINLGTREYAIAPSCYTPMAIKLVRATVNVSEIGRQMRHLTPDQMHVMGQLITQASELAQHGLKFGQPVYVNFGSDDYLTNYFKGYVVGVHVVDGTDHIYVSSDLTFEGSDEPSSRSLLRLMPDSLMNQRQFKKHRDELVAAGKLESPKKTGTNIPLNQWLQLEDRPMPKVEGTTVYEPPSIDTAPSAWLDPFSVTELESLKADKKGRRKADKVVALDSEAQQKRKDRAAKRMKTEVVTGEDGTVYTKVTGIEEVTLPTLPARLR